MGDEALLVYPFTTATTTQDADKEGTTRWSPGASYLVE